MAGAWHSPPTPSIPEVRLNRKKNEPIILKDREVIRTFNEDTKKSVEIKQAEVKEVQLTHEDQIGSIPNQDEDQIGSIPNQDEDKLPPKRRRKPPNTRHNDFLWLDKKTNQM